MRFIDFIQEEKEKHAVLAFGRMNPITSGHEKLVHTVKDIADKVGGSHHIVLSHSQDSAKNPLSGAQKLKHAKRAFPDTNFSVSDKEHPNFLKQAEKLHKSGVTHLHMVGGSDRVKEFHNTLHKYNGTHEGALFNFKKIHVHSAGERDPDAEGTTGISASKMREHAKTGDFHSFKKGAPTSMSHEHVRHMYNDVRSGMNIKEDINDMFEELLVEGVHDKGIFKAVFLAGGPGSGKDYVLDNTLDGHGLTEINSDKALEFLMDKAGLNKKMPASEEDKRNIVRSRAKDITELRQRLALLGRNGLIINGTGDDHDKIKKIKEKLEKIGYETHMIMVNTADEISKQRNIERGQRGGRTVPEEIRKQKWDAVQASRPKLAELFGANYKEYDNSEDLRTAPPEVVKAKKDEMLELFKGVQEFIKRPPKHPAAQEWVAHELEKSDRLPVTKKGAELSPHPDSGAAEEAKKLGLQYFGFGRYGRDGKVTHRSVHDKLVEVPKEKEPENQKAKPNKKINEEFEKEFNMLSESYSLSDSSALNLLLLGTVIDEQDFDIQENKKEVKLLKDKSGKVRTFMLRRAAAKEAHIANGTVLPYKNGYVVKINEENTNVEIPEIVLQTEEPTSTRNTTSIGRSNTPSTREGGKLLSEGVAELTSGQEYARLSGVDNPGSQEKPIQVRRRKITVEEIRKRQKEKVQESIDKGIEPGISMAAAGESPARDMGEKWKKKTGKSTQVVETIGAGGEDATSTSDYYENNLKRKGIDIKTFKAKRPIG